VDSKKTINYLINKDMDAQTSNFTKRLAEKKNISYPPLWETAIILEGLLKI